MSNTQPNPQKWDPLPPLPDWPYVITDEDLAFWSDLMYLRDLCTALVDAQAEMIHRTEDVIANGGISSVADLMGINTLHAAADMLPHFELSFSEPWPHDTAADMLAAWRLQTGPGTAQLAIDAAGVPA